jgi:hypothetical protein
MTSEGANPMDIPTVEKQQFRNESGGFIGVVKIDAKGEEKGDAVEPGETVWLTLAEQIATANAPRRPEDNPFLTQTYKRVNPDDSEIEEYQVTPLVPISESRFVPAGDRPVPGLKSDATAPPAPTEPPTGQGAVEPPPSDPDPAPPTAREMQPPQPPTRAAAAVAEAAAAAAQEAAEPKPTEETPVQEETAQAPVQGTEETGAAAQPTGAPVEGEFAAHEEVGTPTPGGDPTPPGTSPGIAGPPPPWSPGSESADEAEAAGRAPAPDPSGE